jgi:hypothetical protein
MTQGGLFLWLVCQVALSTCSHLVAIPVAASTSQLVTTWHHRNFGPTTEILPARRNLSSYISNCGDFWRFFFPRKQGICDRISFPKYLWQKMAKIRHKKQHRNFVI